MPVLLTVRVFNNIKEFALLNQNNYVLKRNTTRFFEQSVFFIVPIISYHHEDNYSTMCADCQHF